MREIILKSELLRKTFQKDKITDEEIKNLNNLNIRQESRNALSSQELKNISEDLYKIFSNISIRFKEVNIENCSNDIYNLVMFHSTTEDVLLDGSREHLFNLEKNSIKLSEELKKYIPDAENEYSVFSYSKNMRVMEIEPVAEISDIEIFRKYTTLDNLIISIKTKEDYLYICDLINENDDEINLKIDLQVLPELKKLINKNPKIKRKILEMKKFNDFREEDTLGLEDYEIFIRHTEENIMQAKDIYTFDEFTKLNNKIDELILGIDLDDKELNIFLNIYQRLANNIIYEYNSDGDPSSKTEAHNMKGGLLDGKCVCEGYSKILQQILLKAGIESRYIVGETKTVRDYTHAWNQVKIDGKWYNTDLTWDTNLIRENRPVDYCLQGDEEFIDHFPFWWCKYECKESYDIRKIHEYMKFDTLLLESKELFPQEMISLIKLIKEKTGSDLRVTLCEDEKKEEYSLQVGKILESDTKVTWFDEEIEIMKEDILEFLQLFDRENNINKREIKYGVNLMKCLNGVDLVIPNTVIEKLMIEGINIKNQIEQISNKQLDTHKNNNIFEYFRTKIISYIEKIKKIFFKDNSKEENEKCNNFNVRNKNKEWKIDEDTKKKLAEVKYIENNNKKVIKDNRDRE